MKRGNAAAPVSKESSEIQETRSLEAILGSLNRGEIDATLDAFERSRFAMKLTDAAAFIQFCQKYGLPEAARTRLATILRANAAKTKAEELLARGLLNFHIGNFPQALAEFRLCLTERNDDAECLILAAKSCAMVGKLDQAEDYLRSVLSFYPANVSVHLEVGKVYAQQLGNLDAAIHHFRSAIELDPRDASGHFNLGDVLRNKGRREDAVACFDVALEIEPGHVEALNNRGASLQVLNRDDVAVQDFDRAIAVDRRHLFAWMNKATSLHKLERYEESLAATAQALAIDASRPQTWHNQGITLGKLERHEEALAAFDVEVLIAPSRPDAHLSRGNALLSLMRYEEAVGSFSDAISMDEKNTDIHLNMATTLQELGRHREAIDILDTALSSKPGYSDVLWNRSNSVLAFGPTREAWENYEHRLKISAWDPIPDLGLPLLSDAGGKSGKLLIQWEQRFGDVLQMLRYVPIIEQKFECHWQLTRPLVDLARASFPDISICTRDEVPADIDFRTPFTSLPLNCETFSFESIPTPEGYLRSSDEAKLSWNDQLSKLDAAVGLTWRGNTNPPGRSIPLEVLEPILESYSGHLVSLQMDLTEEERHLLDKHSVPHLGDQLGTFDDSAAVVQRLDLVLTIDTALAHLSGAVGTPTWVLLKYGCDWRWYLERDDSPWYSSATLFRQKSVNEWQPVVKEVEERLGTFLKAS